MAYAADGHARFRHRPAVCQSGVVDVRHLKHFSEFAGWAPADLAAVASQARRVRVPAGRWLVRPGRSLAGRFYLLEGRVRLVEGGRSVIVNAGTARARRAVYPGVAGVETLTAAVFLRVDPAAVDAARAIRGDGRPDVPVVSSEDASWQCRFLATPLMQRLEPAGWQRILSAMCRHDLPAGSRIIEPGEPAECCYVLCSGRARIHDRPGRLLAVVEAGGLFGEDALVSGRVRNAGVVMEQAGVVMSLAAAQFQAWLLDVVVRPLADPDGRPVISLHANRPGAVMVLSPGAARVAGARLSRARGYALVGGTWPERTLSAFLLAEQGIDASPVQGADCGAG